MQKKKKTEQSGSEVPHTASICPPTKGMVQKELTAYRHSMNIVILNVSGYLDFQ